MTLSAFRPTHMLLIAGLLFGATGSAAGEAVIVRGKAGTPRSFTLAELRALEQVVIEVEDHGVKATFRGVPLAKLLAEAGAPFGKELRGENLALFVLVTARDGYRAVFALPELDSAFTDRKTIVAHERDGKPLDETEGPLRIVAAGEKRAARWVRQVQTIEIVSVPKTPPR